MPERADTTQVLSEAVAGDADAINRLYPLVYDELRGLARRYLSGGGSDTLQPTALVNEAYLKLIDRERAGWRDRAHFFAVAARAVRQVLIDHARGKKRQKRGGDQRHVSLDEALAVGEVPDTHVLALSQALEKLAIEHPGRDRLVELCFFGGLTHEEIAEVDGVSVRTIERQWRFARAWLYRELVGERTPEG